MNRAIFLFSLVAFAFYADASIPPFDNFGDGSVSIDYKRREIYGVRYNPQNKDVWSGCDRGITEDLRVIKVSPEPTYVEVVYTYNKNKQPNKFYISNLNNSFPNVVKSYFPILFAEGNRLKVTYRNCGSGGFSTITEALLISK